MTRQRATSIMGVALLALLTVSVGTPCLHASCGRMIPNQPSRMTAACCTEVCPMALPGDCGMSMTANAETTRIAVVPASSAQVPEPAAQSTVNSIVAPASMPDAVATAAERTLYPPGIPLTTLHSQFLI